MSEVSLIDGHIDNGISDEAIIKALECCIKNDCDNCPFDSLLNYSDCLKGFLDLINCQKAEVERLQKEKTKLHQLIPKMIKEAKSEAIKEFAERLKIFVIPQKADGYTREIVLKSNIDNLVKEITESK